MEIEQQAQSIYAEDLLRTLADRAAAPGDRARAVIALAGIPEDPEELYRRQKIALVEDEAVFAAALPYLSHEAAAIRRWALRALRWTIAYRPAPADLLPLRPFLSDDARETRYEAIELVGRCPYPEAVDVLEPLLRERDPAITNRVLLALGETGQEAAVDVLLRHRSQGAAVRALARIPLERAVRAALAAAQAKPHTDLWGPLVQSARAAGLPDVVAICEQAIDEINRHYPPR